jgi:hypothetical protein
MSYPVTSWLRAFFALQSRAMESRGFIELDGNDDEPVRWPRTVGSDVIAIAAVFDPYVRRQPLRSGGQGLARRWRAVMDELERSALTAPQSTYAGNRDFWNTLPPLCIYLHSANAPLPEQRVWTALLAQLDEPVALRNVGPKSDGPFKHFDNVKTFDDLFNEQFKYLRELRGADKLKPDAGASGPDKLIPRTTNADVIALADYWSKQLASVKKVFGAAGVEERWGAAMTDVNAVARKGDPNALYPKNNAFWRALQPTAIHVAVADEAPSKSDLAIEAVKDSIKNLPENLKAGANAVSNAVADVAHGAGKIANEAGKGLFAGFGTPLLVGGALVGLFLISRNRRSKES